MSDQMSLELGAYVLGALSPADHAAVDEHLRTCQACREELAELTSLPGLLARVDPDDIAPVDPDPALFARVAAAAAASERPARLGHRARWLTAVAAAVVILAGTGVGVGLGVSRGGRPSAVSASQGPVRISVEATAETVGGTALRVSVAGLPENEHCHLVALAHDGSRHAAGDWVATYAGRAEVTGSTDVPRADLARLTLYGTTGQQLVTVPF